MKKENLRVLLIYSTLYKKTGLPIGLASICSVLQQHGHEVKIFDTAFYDLSGGESSAEVRAERFMSKKITSEDKYFPKKNDIYADLNNIFKNYDPDIVGISTMESAYEISLRLADYIKNNLGTIISIFINNSPLK